MNTGAIAYQSLTELNSAVFSYSDEMKKKDDLASFQNRIFNPSLSHAPRVMTSASLCGEDLNADFSSLFRTLSDLLSPLYPQLDMGSAYSAMGLTTGVNTLQAVLSIHKDLQGLARARDMGDTEGAILCQEDILARMAQFIGGGGYVLHRTNQIANVGFHAGSPALAAAGVWGSLLGNMGFALFFAGAFFMCAGAVARNRKVMQKLDSKNTSLEKIQALIGLTKGSKELFGSTNLRKEAALLLGYKFRDSVKEAINASSPNSQSEWAKLIRKIDNIPKEEWESFGEKVLKSFDDEKSLEPFQKMGFEGLLLEGDLAGQIGGIALETKSGLVKESALARVIGGGNLAALKNAQENGLIERLLSLDNDVKKLAETEAGKLLEGIHSSVERSTFLNRVMYAACILGTGIMVVSVLLAAIVFGAGMFALLANPYSLVAIAALSIICYVAMIVGDGGFWWDGIHANAPVGVWDKAYFYAGIVLCAVSVTLALLIGTNPLGLGIVVAVAACFLAVDFYSLYALDRREKNFKKEHPELSDFKKQIQNLEEDKGQTTFQKLSTTHKEKIFEKLFLEVKRNDLEDAIELRLGVSKLPLLKERINSLNEKIELEKAFQDQRKVTALKKVVEVLEKKLNTLEVRQKETSFAVCEGKAFYDTHENSPAVRKVESAFLKLGYKQKKLLDEEVNKKFYSAIYDQVALEIREAIYEKATLEDLEKAVEEAQKDLKNRADKHQTILKGLKRSSWVEYFTSKVYTQKSVI